MIDNLPLFAALTKNLQITSVLEIDTDIYCFRSYYNNRLLTEHRVTSVMADTVGGFRTLCHRIGQDDIVMLRREFEGFEPTCYEITEREVE